MDGPILPLEILEEIVEYSRDSHAPLSLGSHALRNRAQSHLFHTIHMFSSKYAEHAHKEKATHKCQTMITLLLQNECLRGFIHRFEIMEWPEGCEPYLAEIFNLLEFEELCVGSWEGVFNYSVVSDQMKRALSAALQRVNVLELNCVSNFAFLEAEDGQNLTHLNMYSSYVIPATSGGGAAPLAGSRLRSLDMRDTVYGDPSAVIHARDLSRVLDLSHLQELFLNHPSEAVVFGYIAVCARSLRLYRFHVSRTSKDCSDDCTHGLQQSFLHCPELREIHLVGYIQVRAQSVSFIVRQLHHINAPNISLVTIEQSFISLGRDIDENALEWHRPLWTRFSEALALPVFRNARVVIVLKLTKEETYAGLRRDVVGGNSLRVMAKLVEEEIHRAGLTGRMTVSIA